MTTIFDIQIPELVPPGEKGVAKVKHFTVNESESQITAFQSMQHPLAFVREGRYAKLLVGNTLMMSDTSMERQSNCEFVRRAHGRVLVAGLGLGLILFPLVDRPEVEHITVIEKYQDVIDLVGPSLKEKFGDRLEIVCADIFDWRPTKGTKYNVIYFDVWPDICLDNLKEMEKLHRGFSRFLNRKGPLPWMDSWMKKGLQFQLRRNKSRRW